MATNTYDINDVVRVTSTFTVSSVNTDPSDVHLKIKTPGGITSLYVYSLAEITKSATGIYYKDIAVDDDGMYYYRFEGTGTVRAASEHSFKIRSSEF